MKVSNSFIYKRLPGLSAQGGILLLVIMFPPGIMRINIILVKSIPEKQTIKQD
jgi:hypothetical protein